MCDKGLKREEKALLVGINRYPGAPLAGCVNDVQDMAETLVETYGFSPENVRLLVDERATTQAIKDRIDWLVKVRKGARVFFHFSGHGVQYPTRDYAHEIDGMLEAVCPVDFAWDLDHMLTDKDFVRMFARIPKGCTFTWVNDSCHSGDLTRSMPGPNAPDMIPRMYPTPVDIEWRKRTCRSRSIAPAPRAVVCGRLEVGFVSGCRSDQTSADTYVNGRPCGALTHYFLETLKEPGNLTKPLEEVVKLTRDRLAQLGYTQQPQAEGRRKDKPFMLLGAPGAPSNAAPRPTHPVGPTGPAKPEEDETYPLPMED